MAAGPALFPTQVLENRLNGIDFRGRNQGKFDELVEVALRRPIVGKQCSKPTNLFQDFPSLC